MPLTSSSIYDFLIVFLVMVGISIYFYIARNADYWKKRGVPYKKPKFFFGNMLDVFTSKKVIAMMFKDFYNEIKTPYLGLFVMSRPGLLISDLDLARNILVKDFKNFVDRAYASRKNSIGSIMFSLMRGEEWKLYRKKLGPGFSKVKQNYDLLQPVGQEMVEYLNKKCDKNEMINVKNLGERFGVEVVASMGMGIKPDCFSNEKSSFQKMASQMFNLDNIFRAFSLSCYLLFPKLVNILKLNIMDPDSEAFLYGLFVATVEIRDKTKEKRNDFVDALMKLRDEDKELNLDVQKMAAQAIAFFNGGYETTCILISTCLYELAKNPEKQTKLRNEINKVLKESPNGEFTYEMMSGKLKYLEMVMKETLRKYPPLPFLSRTPLEDYQIEGTDHVIEKGMPLFIPVYAFQMDPLYFPNPEEFIPERFSRENISNIIPYSYMPFGEGPRMCPGEKMGMINDMFAIAQIIQNFEVNLRDESQRKMEFYTKSTILMPKTDKMILKFKKVK